MIRKPARSLALFCIVILVTLQFSTPQHPITAQDGDNDSCALLIEDALQVVGTACVEMGRNEACYGNNAIDVTLQEDVTVSFEDSGDLVDVGDLIALETEPANPDAGTWGIAFMAVLADLPDESDEFVTFILVGDVNLSVDETVEDESTQAFLLESRDDEMCEDAPDGMLIQSPEGERARIVVNGVELEMSSAVFVRAEADDVMGIQGLEGQIDVTADGQTEGLTAGFQTTVPLDGLMADGTPTPLEPIPPGDEFPLDIQTTLLAVTSGGDTPTSAGSAAGLGQTYSDDFASFELPVGWTAVRMDSTDPIIVFSNNPDYVNAALDELPSGTLIGAIRHWSWLNSGDLINNSSADEAVRFSASSVIYRDRLVDGPLAVTLGDHSVTLFFQRGFNTP